MKLKMPGTVAPPHVLLTAVQLAGAVGQSVLAAERARHAAAEVGKLEIIKHGPHCWEYRWPHQTIFADPTMPVRVVIEP